MGPTVSQRLLGILSVFDNERSSWTLSALARRLQMPLSTTHRLVHELLAWGALQRDETGLLFVGSRLWEIGSLYSGLDVVRDTALPYLGDLFTATGHNVHLDALNGTCVVHLAQLTNGRTVTTLTRVGGRLPAIVSATGRILLAHRTIREQEEALAVDVPIYTPATTTDIRALRKELHTARKHGYAITTGQITANAVAVAAPVYNRAGVACTAIAVVADLRVAGRTLVPAVVTSARSISRALGYRPASPRITPHSV